MKPRILFTVISLLLFTAFVKAQVIKGKVVDAETGRPVPNASIHLSGSSRGTTSNARGEFTLNTTETKKTLVVSSIGYEPDTILNYGSKLLSIELEPGANQLRELVIAPGNMTRERQMKIFLTQFIGSRNKDCTITNPDDIHFAYNEKTQTLEAETSRPLIIRNKKLGYKITYYLSAFSYSPRLLAYPMENTETSYNYVTSYKGNYVFEQDTSLLTTAEVKKIRKARDKAYYGSRMHFIRLVLAGRKWYLDYADDREKTKFQYGFNTLDTNYKGHRFNFVFNNIRANKEQLLNYTIINNGARYFSGRPVGGITYNGIDYSEITFETGEIIFKRPANLVPLTPDSYNKSNLVWTGKMAGQRVKDLLPLDFEPSDTLTDAEL